MHRLRRKTAVKQIRKKIAVVKMIITATMTKMENLHVATIVAHFA